MPRERVTVVAGGAIRLYELNGSGLREYATILAELEPEDAAALTLALDGFLGERDRTRRASVSVAPRASRKALPSPTRQAGNRSPGYLRAGVVSYLRDHPEGARGDTIAESVGTTTASVRDCLYRLEKVGVVKRIATGVFVLADNETAVDIARKPRSPHAEEELAAILAYVAAHPGTKRQAIARDLGIETPVTFNNRMARLKERGQIRQELDPERPRGGRAVLVWPTS